MSHSTSTFLFVLGTCLVACSSESAPAGFGAAGTISAGVGGSFGSATAGSSAGGAGSSASGAAGSSAGGAAGSSAGAVNAGGTGGGPSCADPLPHGDVAAPESGAETAATPLTEADFKDAKTAATLFHYAISTPKTFAAPAETDPNKQLGLFICFHEHFGAPHDEPPSVIESLARLKLSGDFVVIGMGQADPAIKGYDKVVDHQNAVKLLEWAKKTYPINARRVYLWGRGEGARMAQELGTEHPELFAGLITYSWGSLILPKVDNPSLNVPDFYIVNGLNDFPTHPPYVRSVYASIKKLGYNLIYREVRGLGQDVPGLGRTTKNPLSNDDAIAWASRLRHKTLPLSAAEQAVLAPFADASAARAVCPDARLFRSLLRVGGTATGAVLPPIFGAQNDAARVMAAQSAALSLFGNDAATALATDLKDASAEVRKAALQALGVLGGWRYLPAQKALIDVVTDKTWEAAERALALAQVGVAVKLQVEGALQQPPLFPYPVFQDPPLFQALVTLLTDEDAALRTAAFAILSPIRASAYKPDAAPTDRAAEASKWQQWLDGIVAMQP